MCGPSNEGKFLFSKNEYDSTGHRILFPTNDHNIPFFVFMEHVLIEHVITSFKGCLIKLIFTLIELPKTK